MSECDASVRKLLDLKRPLTIVEYMRTDNDRNLAGVCPMETSSLVHGNSAQFFSEDKEDTGNFLDIVPPPSSSPQEPTSSSPCSIYSTFSEDRRSSATELSSSPSASSPLNGVILHDLAARSYNSVAHWEQEVLGFSSGVTWRKHHSFCGFPTQHGLRSSSNHFLPTDKHTYYNNSVASPATTEEMTTTSFPRDSSRNLVSPSSDDEKEVSPIVFVLPEINGSSSQSLTKPTSCGSPAYRVIKRAQSFAQLEQNTGPSAKRQKLRQNSAPYRTDRVYAPRTASLRRADDLRSISELESPFISSQVGSTSPPYQKSLSAKVLFEPVPIIAPPADYVVDLPISPELLAKRRLQRFLERETDQRALDGLLTESFCSENVNRLPLDDFPKDDPTTVDSHLEWEKILSMGKERRLNAINWILDVIPADCQPPASTESILSQCSSNSSNTSSALDVDERRPFIQNLLDQLQTSHETRFHACWMFLRFFFLTTSRTSHLDTEIQTFRAGSFDSQSSTTTEEQGHGLLVWDIAVACLSLSVKLHRDFLDPLLPVYADEYLTLSPHGMTYVDLEMAHRDVLSTFHYRLGVSPQLFMNELWFALPSLRELLHFEGGWNHAMEDAWLLLFDAVCKPDVQKFSIARLTTIAIMDGLVESLVYKYLSEMRLSSPRGGPGFRSLPSGSCTSRRKVRRLEKKARDEAEGVLCDIQALVGITDAQLQECRAWIEGLY